MSAVPQSDTSAVIELYKLTVEMADRVSARRAAANSYFLTVETLLVSAAGLVGAYSPNRGWWADATITIAGLLLSSSWWILLGSYRRLSSAKFSVINKIEQSLPMQPFADEWQILNPERESVSIKRRRYLRLGAVERVVPVVYGAIFTLFFLGNRIWSV